MNTQKRSRFKSAGAICIILSMVISLLSQVTVTSFAASTLELQMYNSNRSATTNQISPYFKFINNGTTSINLSGIKIRYYYTKDTTAAQNFACNNAQIVNSNIYTTITSNVTGTFASNDSYVEVGFTSAAGSLAPGAYVIVQTSINKIDWSNYNQQNDYSFDSTDAGYADWNKSTVYQAGALVWGTPLPNYLIVVSNPLYQTGSIASKLSTYMSDLSNEGWSCKLIKINNVTDSSADYICPTPASLKSVIHQQYLNGCEGFVLIGSDPQIPTAYWEYKASDTDCNPTDLFYADQDDWTDSDGDGIYESYNTSNTFVGGSFAPEMFWGRISAGCISSSITDEAVKVSAYFDKIHNYRVNNGNLSDAQKNRVMLFYDCSDFKNWRNQDDFTSLGTEIDGWYDDSLTAPGRLLTELQNGYAFVNYAIHSANDYHQIHIWDMNNNETPDNSFNLSALNSITPKINYINMYSCSACRYQDKVSGKLPNIGATYLFNNSYDINVTGSTGPWGFVPTSTYWTNIASGKPVGKALREYFSNWIASGEQGCPKGALLGDPTMVYKITPVANKAPHITTNLAGNSGSPRLVLNSGTPFEIHATDPENDYVYIDATGIPSGDTVTKSNGCLTWTPSGGYGIQYLITVTAYNKDANNNIINKYIEKFTVTVN